MTDIIIIGGGPAGLSTAIYAKRAGLSATVFDKGAVDCQITKATEVENYLGFSSISGLELQEKFLQHAKAHNISIIKKAIISVEKTDEGFKVFTKKEAFESKYLVLAMGRSHKHLGIEGEEQLSGAGVSYCATCDGFFFKNKTVCVIGGGDSALTQAIYLASLCEKVFLVHRRDTFRASSYLIDRAKAIENIEFVLNASPTKIIGDTHVVGIELSTQSSDSIIIDCEGVFGAIGEIPNIKFEIPGLIKNESGHIITNNYCRTNIDGLYAVGDIREREVYQIVTAVADGALAIEGILAEKSMNS